MGLKVPTHSVAPSFIKFLSIYLKAGIVLRAADRVENQRDEVSASWSFHSIVLKIQ